MSEDLFHDKDKIAELEARNEILERKVQSLQQQLNKQPDAKPQSYYKQMKIDDPVRYASKSVQIDMDRDSQTLGFAFFDTEEPSPRTPGYDKYTGPNAMMLDEHKKVR